MHDTWSEYFFEGCDYIPGLRKDWSQDTASHKMFVCEELLLRKPLKEREPECPVLVWSAIALCEGCKTPVVVKAFTVYTEQEAREQLERRPSRLHGWQDVQNYADPYLLEQRALERINQSCPESWKSFFPKYLGTVELSRRHHPPSYLVFSRGIVMETLQSDLDARCLLSADVPTYLTGDAEEIQERLKSLKLPELEAKWYQSLLVDRLRILTALHSLAITHGDIREEHFRLPGEFHDVGLFDFSRSYTFTPRLPYMTNVHGPVH